MQKIPSKSELNIYIYNFKNYKTITKIFRKLKQKYLISKKLLIKFCICNIFYIFLKLLKQKFPTNIIIFI